MSHGQFQFVFFILYLFQVCYCQCNESDVITSGSVSISTKPCPSADITVAVSSAPLQWKCYYTGDNIIWNITNEDIIVQKKGTTINSNLYAVATSAESTILTLSNLNSYLTNKPFLIQCGACGSSLQCLSTLIVSNPIHVIIYGPPSSVTNTTLTDGRVILTWNDPNSTVAGLIFTYDISVTDIFNNIIINYTTTDTTNITLPYLPSCTCGDCQWTITSTTNNGNNISRPVNGSFSLRSAPSITDIHVSHDCTNDSSLYVNFTVNNVICNENNYTLMEIDNDGDIVGTSPVYPVLIDDRLIVNISITNMTHYIRLLAVNDIGNDTSDDIMIMRDDDIPQVITSATTTFLSSSYSETNTGITSITNTTDTRVTSSAGQNPSISPISTPQSTVLTIVVPLLVVILLLCLIIVGGIIGICVFVISKKHIVKTKLHHTKDIQVTTTTVNEDNNTDTIKQCGLLYQPFMDNGSNDTATVNNNWCYEMVNSSKEPGPPTQDIPVYIKIK